MLSLLARGVLRVFEAVVWFFGWPLATNEHSVERAPTVNWQLMKASTLTKVRLPFKLLRVFPFERVFAGGFGVRKSALPFVRSMLLLKVCAGAGTMQRNDVQVV